MFILELSYLLLLIFWEFIRKNNQKVVILTEKQPFYAISISSASNQLPA
jgi:hypothetical protein